MKAMRAPRELIPLWFSDSKPHVLMIHYANYIGVYPDFIGFQTWLGDYEPRAGQLAKGKQLYSFLPIFAAAELILALLHLLLYLFYPRQKLNLYYAVFVLLVGINGIAVYFYYLTSSPSVQLFADIITHVFNVLLMWSGVSLIYMLDYGRIPKWRLVTLSGISLLYATYYVWRFLMYSGLPGGDYFSWVFLVCMIDSLYSMFHLVRKKQKGVWLIVCGVVAIALVYFFILADVFAIWPYELNALRIFVMGAGNLVLPFCLSLYLALDFARTNQSLTIKLAEVESLSAQSLAQEAEKSELIKEEARRLEAIVQLRTAELIEKAERLREMDNVKSRFFTNITHEFRTPLTLIINPIKELLTEPGSPNTPGHLQLALNNAMRLLQLVNQLLDLSKLENGLMQLNPEPLDLVALINGHINAFRPTAILKSIALPDVSGPPQLWLLGDRDKLDKIILNLLSNAVKFTDWGRIEIILHQSINTSGSNLSLTVRDSGRGIPAYKLPYIFTRFYQADASDTRSAEGTGIGLALVKELVLLMDGDIGTESAEGLFTEIIIRLPFIAAEATDDTTSDPGLNLIAPSMVEDDKSDLISDENSPVILLVEDHEELRTFMIQTLNKKYRILSAAEGHKGLDVALEKVPNLIITDLMMPKMDGYQLTNNLKRDIRTSHIPVIILTAKTDMDSKIQGIETGADAYLGKPFDQRELFALIENLLATRNQLRERYGHSDKWFKETHAMPSIEQEFLTRVRETVQSHINDEGYSADQLATDLGMSRMQLHRKLKALIGQSAGELIRIVRLQYAHDLLKRRSSTVAEVGYLVGFSSPSSFSASFSRHFGFPPSKIVEG
jgi:signal transduction histidine kinase/DNA-binding response OmpR family regulator